MKRRFGVRRVKPPMQWVDPPTTSWGNNTPTYVAGANTLTSFTLVDLSAASAGIPAIQRLKLITCRGWISHRVDHAAADYSSLMMGITVVRATQAGVQELPSPINAADLDRRWLWLGQLEFQSNAAAQNNITGTGDKLFVSTKAVIMHPNDRLVLMVNRFGGAIGSTVIMSTRLRCLISKVA